MFSAIKMAALKLFSINLVELQAVDYLQMKKRIGDVFQLISYQTLLREMEIGKQHPTIPENKLVLIKLMLK